MSTSIAQFGTYQILRRLGVGGMAEVFEAQRVGLEGFSRRVALKCILPNLTKDKHFLEMFINEARLGSQLHHPNIIEIQDFNKVDDIYYIAMEFVDGITLTDLVLQYHQHKQDIPGNIVIDMLCQILEGLGYAHEATTDNGTPMNIIHRDVKPSNILITGRGVLKVADFGIAKAATNLYQTGTSEMTKGSLPYMSPEQITMEEALTPSSDLFAVGVILYEMLSLKPLFDGKTAPSIMYKVVNVEIQQEMLNFAPKHPEFVPILRKAIAKNPKNRYQSARDFIQDLQSIRSHFSTNIILRDLLLPMVKERIASKAHINETIPADSLLAKFSSIKSIDNSPNLPPRPYSNVANLAQQTSQQQYFSQNQQMSQQPQQYSQQQMQTPANTQINPMNQRGQPIQNQVNTSQTGFIKTGMAAIFKQGNQASSNNLANPNPAATQFIPKLGQTQVGLRAPGATASWGTMVMSPLDSGNQQQTPDLNPTTDSLIQEIVQAWGRMPPTRAVSARTNLFMQGSQVDTVFLVVKGKIQLQQTQQQPTKKSQATTVTVGAWLGLLELFHSKPHKKTATAIEDSVVISVPKEAMEKLLAKSSPLLGRAIFCITQDSLKAIEAYEAQALEQTFVGMCKGVELILTQNGPLPESQMLVKLRELFFVPVPALRAAIRLIQSLNLLKIQQGAGMEPVISLKDPSSFSDRVRALSEQWKGRLPSSLGEAPPRESYNIEELAELLSVTPQHLLRRMTMADFPTNSIAFDAEGIDGLRKMQADHVFKQKRQSGREKLSQIDSLESLRDVDVSLLKEVLPKMPLSRLIRLIAGINQDSLRSHFLQALSTRLRKTVETEIEHIDNVGDLEMGELEQDLLALLQGANKDK